MILSILWPGDIFPFSSHSLFSIRSTRFRISSLILPVFHWMNKTQRGRRSHMIRRIPRKMTIAMAIPKGSSLKICSIYHSIPTSVPFNHLHARDPKQFRYKAQHCHLCHAELVSASHSHFDKIGFLTFQSAICHLQSLIFVVLLPAVFSIFR